MNDGSLSYRGQADLTFTYYQTPGLSRVVSERGGVDVVLSRVGLTAPVSVLIDPHLGAELFRHPGLTRVSVLLPDGQLFAGSIEAISPEADYFEVVAALSSNTGPIVV
ncbi:MULTISPECIES: hypothetical protein [Pseudomonas putida group]|uniref:hypothetical protein n=1 Tax=Pseudomonas putida group TaxID=136845 RepID=UPI001E653B0A|nr:MULTISPECIES: hypothetical protein [Pseudomonas putida group]MCE1010096.1 hypothetical protein [Pseudomonas monteilii]MCE1056013.1 hypothetical protein [Pseudomonas alloputida]